MKTTSKMQMTSEMRTSSKVKMTSKTKMTQNMKKALPFKKTPKRLQRVDDPKEGTTLNDIATDYSTILIIVFSQHCVFILIGHNLFLAQQL